MNFFALPNPDLMCTVWAIMGDGCSVPFLYHGRIKEEIKNSIEGIDLNDIPSVLTVITFLQMYFASFCDCRYSNWCLENFGGQYERFLNNCDKIDIIYRRIFFSLNSSNIDEFCTSTIIRSSKPCDSPPQILEGYRNGTFPVIAINAMTLGEFVLEQCVGDQDQPPTSTLGLPVRQLIYGLVSNLMDQSGRACIKEHHPSNDGALEYKVREVTPICKHEELMVTELYCKDDTTKRTLAMQAICEVLHCPETVVYMMDRNAANQPLILVTLVTYC